MGHLLGHCGLHRGSERRAFELSDFRTYPCLIDSLEFTCLIGIVWKTKQNQYSYVQHSPFLRCIDALECPIGALAFNLFFRFNFDNEPFPDLSNKASWYDIKLFPTKDNNQKEITADALLKYVKKMLNDCNINTGKNITHIGRKTQIRVLDNHGV